MMQGRAAVMGPRASGPLQLIWTVLGGMLLLVGLSFLWLVGSQAARRVQGQNFATAMSSGTASASAGTPSLDPKEYRKEELPETSVKAFKVRCA